MGGGVTIDERERGMVDKEVENVEDVGGFGVDISYGEKALEKFTNFFAGLFVIRS